MAKSKWKCFLFGHHWLFVKQIKEDVEIPLKNPLTPKTYMEKPSNIWKCIHCGNVVKTNLNKKPNNTLRKRFELLDNFLTALIK